MPEEKSNFIGGMVAWEQEDYDQINKELLKKAGIHGSEKTERDWKTTNRRYERVPSEEREDGDDDRRVKDKDESDWRKKDLKRNSSKRSRSRSHEKDTRKWFHDKFDFD